MLAKDDKIWELLSAKSVSQWKEQQETRLCCSVFTVSCPVSWTLNQGADPGFNQTVLLDGKKCIWHGQSHIAFYMKQQHVTSWRKTVDPNPHYFEGRTSSSGYHPGGTVHPFNSQKTAQINGIFFMKFFSLDTTDIFLGNLFYLWSLVSV